MISSIRRKLPSFTDSTQKCCCIPSHWVGRTSTSSGSYSCVCSLCINCTFSVCATRFSLSLCFISGTLLNDECTQIKYLATQTHECMNLCTYINQQLLKRAVGAIRAPLLVTYFFIMHLFAQQTLMKMKLRTCWLTTARGTCCYSTSTMTLPGE